MKKSTRKLAKQLRALCNNPPQADHTPTEEHYNRAIALVTVWSRRTHTKLHTITAYTLYDVQHFEELYNTADRYTTTNFLK